MKKHVLMLAMVIGLAAAAPQTQACDGYGYGFGYDYGRLYSGLEFRVPYFAAFPPVYYSYPVPRTYGHSPFAYPPHVLTPDVAVDSAPLEIINPYVPSSRQEKGSADADQTADTSGQPQPLVIINPYVTTGRAVAQVQ